MRGVEVGGQRFGAPRVDVGDAHLLGPQRRQAVRHRAPDAARADQRCRAWPHRAEYTSPSRDEARVVGIVANQPAAARHHRVDRAHGGRRPLDRVEAGDDGLLERMRDVHAGEAEQPDACEQARQVGGVMSQKVGIDEVVAQVYPERPRRRLVHRRGNGAPDLRADQADEGAFSGHGGRGGDLLFAYQA